MLQIGLEDHVPGEPAFPSTDRGRQSPWVRSKIQMPKPMEEEW